MKNLLISLFLSLYVSILFSSEISASQGNEANIETQYSLDEYLTLRGYYLIPGYGNNEGYMTEPQKQQFQEQLRHYPYIKSILEIGLNGGHSAENFFKNCRFLEKFASFDINTHAYTQPAVDYFFSKYGEKFEFIQGDSRVKVPEYALHFPEKRFDLIYIDGNHYYESCLNDILNCRALAHPNTILWVDDYWASSIQQAVNECVNNHLIVVEEIFEANDPCGFRSWIQARYLFD